MAIIGYARTLLPIDDVDAQVDVLRSTGARRVFVDAGVPAGRQVRPEWEHCLDYLRDGEDTLIVVGADRVARSALQLAETLTLLHARGIGFRSLGEPTLDTTADGAAAFLDLLGVVVALDRAGRAEDTRLGLTHARDEGRVGGPSHRHHSRTTPVGEGDARRRRHLQPDRYRTQRRQNHHPPRPQRAVIAANAVIATND